MSQGSKGNQPQINADEYLRLDKQTFHQLYPIYPCSSVVNEKAVNV